MKFANIILLTLIISCQPREEKEELKIDFFEDELLSNSSEPLLKIYCQFDECGEWGGHEEIITITRMDKRSLELTYEEYNVNCDSMIMELGKYGHYARPFKEFVRTTKMEMTEHRKQAILNFSIEMLKSKFRESFPGHAGLILSISNSDSTFLIQTYGGTADHYMNLINSLKLED